MQFFKVICKPKINQFYPADLPLFLGNLHHNIFRFQVPMDNSQRVQIFYADHNLLDYVGAFVLSQKLVLLDHLKQIFSFDELSDDVDMGFLLDAFFEENQ